MKFERFTTILKKHRDDNYYITSSSSSATTTSFSSSTFLPPTWKNTIAKRKVAFTTSKTTKYFDKSLLSKMNGNG